MLKISNKLKQTFNYILELYFVIKIESIISNVNIKMANFINLSNVLFSLSNVVCLYCDSKLKKKTKKINLRVGAD